ncbi:MAG: AMP-binding protein [Mycobacterium sp.]
MDLPDQMRARITTRSDEPLLCYGESWHSSDEFSGVAEQIDAMLLAEGIGSGNPVGVYMRNRPGPVAALAVLLATRRPLVVLNPALPEATVGHDVGTLRPAAVLADPEDWGRAAVRLAVTDAGAHGVQVDFAADSANAVQVIVPRTPGAGRAPADDGVAILMPTSGTTGPPKRIPLRYLEIEHALRGAQEHYMTGSAREGSVRGAGVQICALPPTNISGLWALITVLSGGGRALLQDKFDPEAWSQAVARYRPRSVSVPPAALRMILDAGVDPKQLSSIKAVWAGAAPVGSDLADAFEKAYGCPVLLSYGATEFSGGITGWSLRDWQQWKDTKRGSVGRAHPGVEISVIDPESEEVLAAGQHGLLQVRSAQAAGGDGHWVTTKDLGSIDEDGFVWIHGRADDVINRGGFKIFPAEIEECLEVHPQVREVVAFGIADERLGQVPVAMVVAQGGVSSDDLVAWAKSRLPAYKAPVTVRTTDCIPRNAAMKVLRGKVRQQFQRLAAQSKTPHPAQRLIGQVLFDYEMPIERGKIREFAAATGATDPLYHGTNPPVPPTFLATAMHWEPQDPPLATRLGLDLTRVLQGGQEYRFIGPLPRAGDTLHAETSVESVTDKQDSRGDQITLIVVLTRFLRSDGAVAAEGRATIIERALS